MKKENEVKEYTGPDGSEVGQVLGNSYSLVSTTALAAAVTGAVYDTYRRNRPLFDKVNELATKGVAATAGAYGEAAKENATEYQLAEVLAGGAQKTAEKFKDVEMNLLGPSTLAKAAVAVATLAVIASPIVGQVVGRKKVAETRDDYNQMSNEITALKAEIKTLSDVEHKGMISEASLNKEI